ncbi:MAG TPA: type II toxin-antitoxin system RelE/ParE family toxin [Stellaceae bacterium]|nr:type II toxin-antitoxin system RelE/ParE family toxin [Stellaceae bacterium]
MKIRYTPRARNDIDDIYDYIAQQSPGGARRVLQALLDGVAFAAKFPEASVRTENPAVRVKTVLRYRYRIFYRVSGETVEILHVRHASRRAIR